MSVEEVSRESKPRATGVLARLRRDLANFHEAERRVAEAILARPEEIIGLSVTQVADLSDVSEATVVRFCQSLGFSGFAEMKLRLASELAHPFQLVHADIEREDGPEEILEKVMRSNMQAFYDTLSVLDRHAFRQAVEAIAAARSLLFFGVGTSAPIALDASYRFDQLGYPSTAVTDALQMAVRALLAGEEDLVFGISNSGATRATIEALRLASQAGARTVCITSFERSPIVSVSDIALVVATRESAYRLEAMAGRLAHLAVLDALMVAAAHREPVARERHLRRSAEVIAHHRY